MRGVDWQAMKERFRPRAVNAASRPAFAAIVNEMLMTLKTSHTWYYVPEDTAYYQLLGVFEWSDAYKDELDAVRASLPGNRIGFVGIGVDTCITAQGLFVSAVFDGGPADLAGVLVGDRLIAVAGQPFHPIESFRTCDGQEVLLTVQRTEDGPSQDIKVVPRFLEGKTMFVDAMRDSARVVACGSFNVGYIHAWSYAGRQYQDLLEQNLFGGKLAAADALVLDLRDGWGGASTAFLNLFNRQVPVLVMQMRDGRRIVLDQQWRKPVVLVINERSRSGKEAFAYGFKKLGIGPVVGCRTAGAVVSGSLRFLPDSTVLYLAVGDVEVDGARLEGVGVEPTRVVERPIPFSQGRDPQLEAALGELGDVLSGK
jgi:carboxyl-terminal processing protease